MAILRLMQPAKPYTAILAIVFAAPLCADERAKPEAKPSGTSSVHISTQKSISFPWNVTDGSSISWDIQYTGTVESGSTNVYSSGMFLYINSNNFYPNNSSGWINKEGDEVEVGPQQSGGPNQTLKVYRRIKVFKDVGMARWLEIIENNSSQATQVNVQIFNNFCYGVRQITTSSGGNKWTDKDWACISSPNDNGGNIPSALHILCDTKAKIRPALISRGNNLTTRYALNIPAKTTYIICSFESLGQTGSLQKIMKDFRSFRYLKDLPGDVRKMIINFSAGAGYAQIDLDRGERSDMAMVTDGNPVYGKILNESFRVQTRFGRMDIPSANVLGMAATKAQDGTMQIVLTDGQIVCGKLNDDKLRLRPSTGGELAYPFQELSQWSYQISSEKPEDVKFLGPYLILRTGDKLAFDPDSIRLSLETQHGPVKLVPKTLLSIQMDAMSGGIHTVTLLNESSLSGLIEPSELSPSLRLGPKVKIPRDIVSQIQYSPEPQPGAGLTKMTLINGDELLGSLTDAEYKLVEKNAPQPNPLKPQNIKNISFKPELLGTAEVTIWDLSVRKGIFQNADFNFEIIPGPTLKINASQIVAIELAQPTPPEDIIKEVEALIARLGSESHLDRDNATDALIKKGSVILVLLKKNQNTADPEVKQRIQKIIETIETSSGLRDSGPDNEDSEERQLNRQLRLRG